MDHALSIYESQLDELNKKQEELEKAEKDAAILSAKYFWLNMLILKRGV